MSALATKLRRDLWHVRGQALSIALVLASGVGCFVMFLATLDSLIESRDSYYRDNRFADVFVKLKRAPEPVRGRLASIEGVRLVETRVVAPARIVVPGYEEPVTGIVTSLPAPGTGLNLVDIDAGRAPTPREAAAVVSEAFASAHDLEPGAELELIIRGQRAAVPIVGIGGSPEYIHQLAPGGLIPDFEHFGVLWMPRASLARAYDMEGAFNDAVFLLDEKANEATVLAAIDRVLDRYGGTGAVAREDQSSHRFLAEELAQIENLAGIFPAIFLFVAAFLVNVVVGRIVAAQREQIAALKAFGYGNLAISGHYASLVTAIASAGIVIGLVAGARLGTMLSMVYVEFFRLPYLVFTLNPTRIAEVSAVTLAAALAGAIVAIARAARLAPAAAMRPEPPAAYRRTPMDALGLAKRTPVLVTMISRHVLHRPLKSGFTVVGIALACAILMTGRFQEDTIEHILGVYYGLEQRDDLAVTFTDPRSLRAIGELKGLPGVLAVEGTRIAPVRLISAHRSYTTAISGFERDGDLRRLVDASLAPVTLPDSGLVLSGYLAREVLGVNPGDKVQVEVREGARRTVAVTVAALVEQFVGVGAYMERAALNRLLGEGPAVSGAYLAVDPKFAEDVHARIAELPAVASVRIQRNEMRNFRETMDETMLFWTAVATTFAVVIAMGVVYNGARVTLTDLSRELASMRVLGFTRGEISFVLLGEIGLVTLVAIPLGLVFGQLLCAYIATAVQTELYRIPLILEPHTYAFAATLIAAAAAASALLVRRRLDRLDLVAVLKRQE